MSDALPYNREIRDLLDDIAALNPLVGPDELVALWFDTLYFPAQNYLGNEQLREWAACFAPYELAVLATFHREFDAVAGLLVNQDANWRSNSSWIAVAEAAKVALERMDGDVYPSFKQTPDGAA